MKCSTVISRCPRLLAFAALLVARTGWGAPQTPKAPGSGAESTLVRVEITVTTEGAPQAAEVAGRQIPNYRPKIIETFPSTGVVVDEKGNILTFLGYSWVDCQGPNRQVEVVSGDGEKHKGKLIGIDQSIGAAVVRSLTGRKLAKTPLCLDCEIRDGATIVSPVWQAAGASQFFKAQVLSVGRGNLPAVPKDGYIVTVSRPLPGIGEPILDTRHRVLGFVASQDSPGEALVYTISQLVRSAQSILRAGGDIQTGWLGVYVDADMHSQNTGEGVTLNDVVPGGPAERAGLQADDTVTKWNGKKVVDPDQFIQMVMETSIGSTASIEFLREGKRLTTSALIEARKPQEKSAGLPFDLRQFITFPDMPQPFFMGLAMVQITPQLAEFLQMPGRTGVLVSSVEPNTPFSQAGILVGDVIVAVDGQPVRDSSTLLTRFQSLARGGRLLLKLVRKGSEHSTTVLVPSKASSPNKP